MKKANNDRSPFSRIGQIGVVVKDVQKAVEHFSSLGIGPFGPLTGKIVERWVHGKAANDVKNQVKVASVGEIELELVEPTQGESIQKKFLKSRGEGVNHLGFFVDDLEGETTKLVEKGFQVIMNGKFAGGGGFAYFDTDKLCGLQFELIQLPPQ